MPPTLPSPRGEIFRVLAMLGGLGAACHRQEPPVAPGPPIPAEPDVTLDTMDRECAGMVSALEAWGTCPNADADDKAETAAWIDAARTSFEASKKGHPDAKAQRVIALACHKAATSVRFAIQRCAAGPKPRGDY